MTTRWEDEGGYVPRHYNIICPLCKKTREFESIGYHLVNDHNLPRGTRIHPRTGEQLSSYSSAAGLYAEDGNV